MPKSNSSKTNSLVDKAKKFFKVIIYLGLIAIIGTILATVFLFGWGEAGYVVMFAIIIFVPIFGILCLIGVIMWLIGLFKDKRKI